jgi:hypothetical protein
LRLGFLWALLFKPTLAEIGFLWLFQAPIAGRCAPVKVFDR